MSLVWQLAGTTIPSDAFVVFSGGKLEMRKGADALKCRGCDALTVALLGPRRSKMPPRCCTEASSWLGTVIQTVAVRVLNSPWKYSPM